MATPECRSITWARISSGSARSSLAANASPRERDYIAALALRYPSPEPASDWLGFHRAYSDAMRAMVAKYPDDVDAATLFAESLMMLRPWQLWSFEGEPAPGTLELVSVLESVLRRDPNHPGANHFYIHAVEASRNLERFVYHHCFRGIGLVEELIDGQPKDVPIDDSHSIDAPVFGAPLDEVVYFVEARDRPQREVV